MAQKLAAEFALRNVVERSIDPLRDEVMGATLVLALLVQFFAGLTLRGLYADGAHFVNQIIGSQNFDVEVHARWMSSIIFELPAVAIIKFGVATPYRVAWIFSVATNDLPGFIFLLCRATLTSTDVRFLAFPAYVYFAGTLAAQFVNTEGLVATAYLWLLLYLILFGRLAAWRLGFIVILSICSVRLHEETSFLGPVLVVAVLLRWRDAATYLARLALSLALVAILVSAALGTYAALYPGNPPQRASLISDLLLLRWIYVPGAGCNLPAALGLAAGIAILVCITAPKISRAAVMTFGVFGVALAAAAFWVNILTAPEAQFAARDNAAFLSFPLMIAVLGARFVPATFDRLTAPPVQAIVLILGLSVTLWHIQATEKWSKYLSHFRSVLASNKGIIPSVALLYPPGTATAELAAKMIWPLWTNPDLSILALPRRCMTSIIDNPVGTGWHPYSLEDPSTLPRIPGMTYTYYLSADRQAVACPPIQP